MTHAPSTLLSRIFFGVAAVAMLAAFAVILWFLPGGSGESGIFGMY